MILIFYLLENAIRHDVFDIIQKRLWHFEIRIDREGNRAYKDTQVASASAPAHIHDGKGCGDGKCEMNMARLEEKSRTATVASVSAASADGKVPYITEENLLAAQSNIVNPNEYNKELHSDNLYGSQGLDTKHLHIRGYDMTNALLGSLSYEII